MMVYLTRSAGFLNFPESFQLSFTVTGGATSLASKNAVGEGVAEYITEQW